ncbi:MAG: hypothetical protein ALECFALPRED_004644 [Alectoria fallacina]|uniref:Uncharacterized protein n=1 Tax=Alectoria fallacina TaxID=1903189 RepID=A0A8H3FWY2_9LECA|nr:MAG: hypothetical protein ALECFALPRED_004644 [Alectoria fallacina]
MKIGSLSYKDPEDDDKHRVEGPHVQAKTALVANILSQYGFQISAIIAKVYGGLLPHVAKSKVKAWTDDIESGEPAAVVILLLGRLLFMAWCHDGWNLENLYIYAPGQDWWRDTEWGNLFRSLTITARNSATNKLKVFSRLSELHLIGVGDDGGMEADAVMLTPFMALPTMRKNVGRVVDGRNFRWSYGTGTSEVTLFDLEGDIDTISLSDYIRGFKALEHFRYQFSVPVDWKMGAYGRGHLDRLKSGPRADNDAANNGTDEEGSDEDNSGVYGSELDLVDKPKWEPRAITATLLQYACNSLVSLDLTAAGFKGAVRFPSDEPFIGSLRSFRVLKHVCLDTMMLFKKVKCSNNGSWLRGKSIQQTSWEEIRVQWLVGFLPVTIESIKTTNSHVGNGLSENDVAGLFTGLPELRDRVPNLLKITVEWKKDRQNNVEKEGWEEMCFRCEENGIELFYGED